MKFKFRSLVGTVFCCGLMLVVAISTTGCGFVKETPVAVDDTPKDDKVDGTVLRKLDPGSYYQTWETDTGRIVSFCAMIPEAYSGEKPVPLVLSLHFGVRHMTQFFGNKMMHGLVKPCVQDLDAIIIAPDVINKSWTNFLCEEAIMDLMNEVVETYNIDRKRIVVVGYSIGAEGVWHLAGNHPDFFTAAIPISGRPPEDYMSTNWTVPMLVIHSSADEVYPFEETQQAIAAIDAKGGGFVQFYPLEGISHYESGKFLEPLKEAVKWVTDVWDAADK